MRVVNLRIPHKIDSRLVGLARKNGLTKSEVVRQAIVIYLQLVENLGAMIRPVAFRVKPSDIDYLRRSDVVIMKVPSGHAIIVASTSSGGIGPKTQDSIKVDGQDLGRFMARVALMDLLALGAFPLLVSASLGVEKDPVGASIIQGISQEVASIGLNPNQVVNANTEENITTTQTGIGITVIGLANEDELRVARTTPGDALIAIGKPKVGTEVIPAEARGEIADLKVVNELLLLDFVHDIQPVGSSGIALETQNLCGAAGLRARLVERSPLDLKKSAGPATVVLATVDMKHVSELKRIIRRPCNLVGKVY